MRRFVFLLSLMLWPAGTLSSAGPVTLNFGVVPTESSINLRKDYEPLRAALERELGQPVEMFFASDYTGVIEAMRFNQVQLTLMGNNSAIDAVDRAQAEVFAQTIDKDGNAGYWSLIIVHKDSPITTFDELLAQRRELTFALGDPQSTSGTLVPGYYAFAVRGINPASEFKALRHANHEANILGVANRQLDAATCSNETMFRVEQYRPEMAARVRAIWRGPMIASDPLLFRRALPEELKSRIVAFFAGYGDTEAERASIAPLKWAGFRRSTDAQLLPYRLLRVAKEKASVEADPELRPPEKAVRLAELAAREAELERAAAAATTGGG